MTPAAKASRLQGKIDRAAPREPEMLLDVVVAPRWAVWRRDAILGRPRPEHVGRLLPNAPVMVGADGCVLVPSTFSIIEDGTCSQLTHAEFLVLERLMTTPNQPVSRTELRRILGYGDSLEADGRLRSVIHQLRHRLTDANACALRTVHRRGYMWSIDPEPA